jgi:hypothetical protein
MLSTPNLQNHLRLEGQTWGLHTHCGKHVWFISDVMVQITRVQVLYRTYKVISHVKMFRRHSLPPQSEFTVMGDTPACCQALPTLMMSSTWKLTPFSHGWSPKTASLHYRNVSYLQILLSVKHDALRLDFPVLDVDFVPTENNGDVLTHSDKITVPVWNILVCNSGCNVKHYNGTLPLKGN